MIFDTPLPGGPKKGNGLPGFMSPHRLLYPNHCFCPGGKRKENFICDLNAIMGDVCGSYWIRMGTVSLLDPHTRQERGKLVPLLSLFWRSILFHFRLIIPWDYSYVIGKERHTSLRRKKMKSVPNLF